MPIRFKCPECLASIEAPDGTHGELADCPACHRAVTVPAAKPPPLPPPGLGFVPGPLGVKTVPKKPNAFASGVGVLCFGLCGILALIFVGSFPFEPPRYGSDAFTEEVRILWYIRSLLILLCGMVAFYIGYRIQHDEKQ